MMTEKLRWNPTVHAVRRLKERYDIAEEHAKNFVNQLMQNAKYVTTSGNRTTYKHEGRNAFIIVNTDDNIVITVHDVDAPEQKAEVVAVLPAQSVAKITIDRISNAVKREFARMSTQINREVRKMSEQQAQLNVQIAELSLNKVRCYHPPTKALIQSRIDSFASQVTELAQEIDAKLTQIQTAETEVKAVVGE